jgi:putative membrane protein|tara:strand:- start:406 stop:819 length:414 start_codon:yes stop_codon:yes gene_type:complete
MQPVIDSFISGLPILMLHSSVTIAILLAGIWLYIWMTPWDEMALIRKGNNAAALSLGGAIVGLALPLAIAMAASVSVYEIILWGPVTLILQIIAYRVADIVMRTLPKRIEDGQMSAAILLVSIKLAAAIINAAAVSG